MDWPGAKSQGKTRCVCHRSPRVAPWCRLPPSYHDEGWDVVTSPGMAARVTFGLGLPGRWSHRQIYKAWFCRNKIVRTGDRCYSFPLLSLVVNLCFWFVIGLRYCQWELLGDLVRDSTVVAAQRIRTHE